MIYLYTIYNGIIEQYELIKETPTAYRIKYTGYENGRLIYRSRIILKQIHSNEEYTTLDKTEAVACALAYAGQLSKQITAINLSIEAFAK